MLSLPCPLLPQGQAGPATHWTPQAEELAPPLKGELAPELQTALSLTVEVKMGSTHALRGLS